MAHSSRGLGHLPLKEEITGSNPVCATLYQINLAADFQTVSCNTEDEVIAAT